MLLKTRQVYTTVEEEKSEKRNMNMTEEKINDKLISRRTKRNLFFFFSIYIYICIDLNKRYVHGLFNEFKLLLCIYYIYILEGGIKRQVVVFVLILCKKKNRLSSYFLIVLYILSRSTIKGQFYLVFVIY